MDDRRKKENAALRRAFGLPSPGAVPSPDYRMKENATLRRVFGLLKPSGSSLDRTEANAKIRRAFAS
jgi:hypothetical protein